MMDWTVVLILAIQTIFLAGVFIGASKVQTKALKESIDHVAEALKDHVYQDREYHKTEDERIRYLEMNRK
jgi:hypothetical protein